MSHYTSSMNGQTPSGGHDPMTQQDFRFDDSMFFFDTTVETTVSQPFQATLPGVKQAVQKGVKREAPSPPPERRPAPGASPKNNSNYSLGSPGGYLDPMASSPAGVDFGGYSVGTTPGFDTLEELPDLNRVDTYDFHQQTMEDEEMPLQSASTSRESRYPPSPRLTVSPLPHTQTAPSVLQTTTSPTVKVEDHTSTSLNHAHLHSPISHHQQSSSSSSSGLNNDSSNNITIIRDDDGNWRSGGGLNPEVRDDTYLPLSLKDQEFERLKQAKAAEIEEWLRGSMERLPRSKNKNQTKGGLAAPSHGRHRASSISDFRHAQVSTDATDGSVHPGESSASRTVLVDETEDYHYDDDDSSVATDWREGSLDLSLSDSDDIELPPTAEELAKTAEDEMELERLERERDPALHPNPRQFFSRQPWVDIAPPVTRGATAAMRTQPATAIAAMQKFTEYARNIETASRVATFGSGHTRRNSTGDADKVGVVLKRLSFGREKNTTPPGARRPSIWGGFGKNLKRTLSSTADKDPADKDKLSSPASGHRGRGASFGGAIGGNSSSSTLSSSSPFAPSRLGPSFAPSLRLDTSAKPAVPSIGGAFAQMTSPLMAAGAGTGSHAALPTSPTAPHKQQSTTSAIMGHLTRNRSKSDLQRKHVFGVVTSLIGPALPKSASPSSSSPATTGNTMSPGSKDPGIQMLGSTKSPRKFTFGEETKKKGVTQANQLLSPESAKRRGFEYDDEDMDGDDDAMGEDDECVSPGQTLPQPMPQQQQMAASSIQQQQYHHQHQPLIHHHQPQEKFVITPTLEGFAAHISFLNPQLHPKLVDRFAHEQCKRFRKLVEHRQKHLKALNDKGVCSNGAQCRKVRGQVGVGSTGTVGVAGHRRGGSGGKGDEDAYDSDATPPPQSTMTTDHDPPLSVASFPPSIPIPPTSHLPASFECPICFRHKKFAKPSDWTKHVHEDVQPFTCTFLDCTEPKSFKRKADWVRHENERHRHLEWWKCNQRDCEHTCYRKDNFVQHLVREHKMVEPKRKASEAPSSTKGGRGNAQQAYGNAQADHDRVWRIVDACHQETRQPPQSEKCRFCGASCGTFKKLTVHLARHMEAIALPILELVTDEARAPPAPVRRRGAGVGAAVGVQQPQQQQQYGTAAGMVPSTVAPGPQIQQQHQPLRQPQQPIPQQQQMGISPSMTTKPPLSMTTNFSNPIINSAANTSAITPITPEMMTPVSMVNIPSYQLTPPTGNTHHSPLIPGNVGIGYQQQPQHQRRPPPQQLGVEGHLQNPHLHHSRRARGHQRTPSAPELASMGSSMASSLASSPNLMHQQVYPTSTTTTTSAVNNNAGNIGNGNSYIYASGAQSNNPPGMHGHPGFQQHHAGGFEYAAFPPRAQQQQQSQQGFVEMMDTGMDGMMDPGMMNAGMNTGMNTGMSSDMGGMNGGMNVGMGIVNAGMNGMNNGMNGSVMGATMGHAGLGDPRGAMVYAAAQQGRGW